MVQTRSVQFSYQKLCVTVKFCLRFHAYCFLLSSYCLAKKTGPRFIIVRQAKRPASAAEHSRAQRSSANLSHHRKSRLQSICSRRAFTFFSNKQNFCFSVTDTFLTNGEPNRTMILNREFRAEEGVSNAMRKHIKVITARKIMINISAVRERVVCIRRVRSSAVQPRKGSEMFHEGWMRQVVENKKEEQPLAFSTVKKQKRKKTKNGKFMCKDELVPFGSSEC